ncbi:penicillin acylase family protein [Alkalicoccus daliensis]|uniref:Penicillin amidase n=1 Tax=Alkalicoccus daliensis TaxID=745820 RepID=A0A1H0HSE1_9BACI|nr:penicillin acylase family protein [Alkalicoccus daliensis]SDO22053.1 penicillin amidase [Alkalicoccus daliensis]
MRNVSTYNREYKSFFQRRWVKALLWIGAVIAVLIILGLFAANWFVGKSHPELDGAVLEAPVSSEVEVVRDDRGVAKIISSDIEDLFFAQGYVMAQDRLFQMDMTRRLAGGKLSEVVGEAALESDKYFRTYGMHRATEALTEEFDQETREIVEAFAAGVTAYIDTAFAEGEQPLEFRILGYEPEPWTIEDTAIAVKYMGYTLTGNFEDELKNYELLRMLGPEAAQLFPDYHRHENFPVIGQEAAPHNDESTEIEFFEENGFAQALYLEEVEELLNFVPDTWNGSNNWAVSGEYTESGMPMLGDDPHLGLAVPSVWYQTHLELEDDFHSIGVTVPGIPGVVLGHNGKVSWGVTSMSADYEDVFLEQVNPEAPNEFLFDGEWEEAELIDEEIYIEGEEEPYIHRVEITRNGPVMNKIMEEGPYQAFSLRWSGLEAGEELNGILRLNRAENAEEFAAGLEGFVTPGLSWVFADTEGNIGYRGQALLPVRNESDGRLPVPGWEPEYQWDGFVPAEDLPAVMNPDSGYIMTANHSPIDETYEYEIGRSYFPYRGLRLEEMIAEKITAEKPFTLDTMKEMQLDVTNTQARMLVPLMTEAVARWDSDTEEASSMDGEELDELSALEQEALDLLQEWDYTENADSAEALIWQIWYETLPEAMFERYLHVEVTNHLSRHFALEEAADHPEGILFGFLDERWHVSFAQAARETFYEAVTRAEEMQGGDTDSWAWGDWHAVKIEHPLGAVWPLNHLLNVEGEGIGGSGFTPGAASYDIETGAANHGAGWRFIADLASPDTHYDVNIPGQSGQWRSPYYDDQLEDWTAGEYEQMIYDKEEQEDMDRVRFIPSE